MKVKERQQARILRKQGWSINHIYRELGIGKGTASVWVRDIELTKEQVELLSQKGHTTVVVEKRRQTRLAREEARRKVIVDIAELEFKSLRTNPLFLTGIALYWAEGGKRQRGLVRLSNGDPEMIRVFMRFLREFCKVPEEKFRGHIHIHPHLDPLRAEHYWSKISRIPLTQFFKTYNKPNKSSKNKRDSLPYGTFDAYVCDTELFLKIQGWTQGLRKFLDN